jgi:glycyl-tRNA synthetase beta chain
LEKLKEQPDFQPLASAFKRVVNLIKKEGIEITRKEKISVNDALFTDQTEASLLHAVQTTENKVNDALEKGIYTEALFEIVSLHKPVDDFFEGVLVMDDNPEIRNNRFALLGKIAALFEKIADFSKIST